MNSDKIVAFIDIGGSSLKAHVCSEAKSQLVKTQKWKANENIEDSIIKTSKTIKDSFKCTDVIIGLPGPIDRSKKHVFCPPLNLNISLEKLNIIADLVVNDVVCQAGILSNSLNQSGFNNQHALITIGTSLGLCLFEINSNIYDTLMQAQSYEIAHEFLAKWSIHSETNDISSFIENREPRVCTLFSVGGLCAYMGGAVEIKNKYMLTAKQEDISKIVNPNMTRSQREKLNIWFKHLQEICKNYLAENGLNVNSIHVIFSGGIIDAMKQNNITLNMNDCTLVANI